MTRPRPLELKREAVDILLAQWKLLDAANANKPRSVYEEAIATLYELILYHEMVKMEPDDAAIIEEAADKHRQHPHAQQLPAPPVEPPLEATQLPA